MVINLLVKPAELLYVLHLYQIRDFQTFHRQHSYFKLGTKSLYKNTFSKIRAAYFLGFVLFDMRLTLSGRACSASNEPSSSISGVAIRSKSLDRPKIDNT